MSYQVHNFQTGEIIEAAPINEMDAQIRLNEQNIELKLNSSQKGAANGVAELDENGHVPLSQLSSMSGASASESGAAGMVPQPTAGDNNKFLRGDGQWEDIVNDEAGLGNTLQTWSADKLEREFDAKAPSVVNQDVGIIATIEDGKDGAPVEKLIVNIEPMQEGTGDPSSTNVRNINGRTSVQIGVAAKNLISGLPLADAVVRAMPTAIIDTTLKRVNFASNATANLPIVGRSTSGANNCFRFKGNTQYTFILTYDKNTGVSSNMRVAYTDGTYTDLPTIESATTKGTIVYVSTAGKTISSLYKRNNSGTTHLYYEESGIFEGVLIAEEFEEWKGTVYAVNFPSEAGTVYGCKLIINNDGTGKLIVNSEYATITGSDLNAVGDHSTVEGLKYARTKASYSGKTLLMCDSYKAFVFDDTTTPANNDATIANDRIYFYSTEYGDLDAVKAQFDSNNVHCVLSLPEPIEYDLSCPQVKTLLGLNNIYCDAGEVEVEYTADTKLYIDKAESTVKDMIADSDVDVATVDHAKNDIFICGDLLYRAIAPIAVGDALAVGTNVESITLAQYIALLEEKALAAAMTPLNQSIFPNYDKNLQVNTGGNLRYADVLYNTIRSTGMLDKTGTTYKSVVMTSQGRAVIRGRVDQDGNVLYKSYFRTFTPPSAAGYTYKLCLYSSYYENRNGATNNSSVYLFTYDDEGIVTKCIMSPGATEAYYDRFYVLPDAFINNKNIAVIQMYRNAKGTAYRKLDFMILASTQVPDYYSELEASTLTNPVVDDITPSESNVLSLFAPPPESE